MAFLPISVLILAASVRAYPHAARVREVASFPVGTWLENLAVRASGELLVTRVDVAEVWSVSPLTGRSARLAVLPNATAAVGITEVEQDVFAVVAGTQSGGFPVPGTFSIWTLNLRSRQPKATKVADVPSASFLNGLTALPGARAILAADSGSGVVYRVDLRSGNATIVLSGEAYAAPPPPAYPLGINGVHVQGSSLFFTNTGAATFSRVRIRPDGTAAGPVEALSTGIEGPDDFALSPNGPAFITVNQIRSIVAVDPKGSRVHIAGGANSTDFATPTAAQFGRTRMDSRTLYVTTAGLRDENSVPLAEAKIMAVTL